MARRAIRWLLAAAVLGALAVAVAAAQTREIPLRTGWVTIQNSSQGYALQVPETAKARLFEPEGILRIAIIPGGDQVISVQPFANPERLALNEWVDAHFLDDTRKAVDPLVPVVPLVERRSFTLGGLPAETMLVISPVNTYRRTVVSADERIYLIGYPTGGGQPEHLYERIVETLRPGEYPADQGYQVAPSSPVEEIPVLPVPYYSQRDPRWTCDQIGTCWCYMGACIGYTGIGDAGCYITAEAMIFDYYTGGFMDPLELDTCLTQNGGYTYWAGCGYGLCATSYNPLPACSPAVVSYQSFSSNLSLLDQDLRDGYPVVAWVDWGSHYVVVVGKRDGKYQILDPLYARTEIYPGQIIHFVRYHGPLPAERVDLQPGFPVQAYHSLGSVEPERGVHALVSNLDGDPSLEVALTALSGGPLYAWNADSSLMATWPPAGDLGAASPAAGNLASGGGQLEVVAGYAAGSLVAYTPDGSVGSGWPIETAPGPAPPVLADVDGDGLEEIFFAGRDGWLHAYRPEGTPLNGWPVQLIEGPVSAAPAIADLDADGALEIIALSEPAGGLVALRAYRYDGTPVSGFPATFTGIRGTSPVVGDVDADGAVEIIVPGAGSLVYQFSATGELRRTHQAVSPISDGSLPALADMDGDGFPEIVVQADRALNVFKGDGSSPPGWPESWGSGYTRGHSSPVVGDVDGDGLPEVVILLQSLVESEEGQVRIYDHRGRSLPRFPRDLPVGRGAVPALGDIDGDGRHEIVVAATFTDAPHGFYDTVWAFDLGGPPHGAIEWGQRGGGPEGRGAYPVPAPPAQAPVPLPTNVRAFLPVLAKPFMSPVPGISGRVTLNGAGAAGIPLTLRAFDGQEWSDLASATTTSDGSYQFNGMPALGPGEALAVRYQSPAPGGGTLAAWNSRPISAFQEGSAVKVSVFDLADLTLVAPQTGMAAALPVVFEWSARPVAPTELYALVLRDPQTGSLNYQSPLVRGSGTFTLAELPPGLNYGSPYEWTVWVYGPDGALGLPMASRTVIFSP